MMDLTTITAFLSQYGMWGILLAGVLIYTREYWLPAVQGLLNRRATVPNEDADVIDIGGLHLVQSRAKRSGCPKFLAATRELELCWFNHAEEPK